VRPSPLIVQVDGTPGLPPVTAAGIGLVVRRGGGAILRTACLRVAASTSVEAEYQAVIAGLTLILRHYPAAAVRCMSDCEVVVEQILGNHAVRVARLRPLHAHAVALAAQLPGLELLAIPRALNRLADALAWEALAGRESIVRYGT
jgi:ribonuclease HI